MTVTGRTKVIRVGTSGGTAFEGASMAFDGSLTGEEIVPFDTAIYDSGGYIDGLGTSGAGFVVPRTGIYLITINATLTLLSTSADFYVFGVATTTTDQIVCAGGTAELPGGSVTVAEILSATGQPTMNPTNNPVQVVTTWKQGGITDVSYNLSIWATIQYVGPIPV